MAKIYRSLQKLKMNQQFNYKELYENIKRVKNIKQHEPQYIYDENLIMIKLDHYVLIHNDDDTIVVAQDLNNFDFNVKMIVKCESIDSIINEIKDIIWSW